MHSIKDPLDETENEKQNFPSPVTVQLPVRKQRIEEKDNSPSEIEFSEK